MLLESNRTKRYKHAGYLFFFLNSQFLRREHDGCRRLWIETGNRTLTSRRMNQLHNNYINGTIVSTQTDTFLLENTRFLFVLIGGRCLVGLPFLFLKFFLETIYCRRKNLNLIYKRIWMFADTVLFYYCNKYRKN